MLKLDEVRCFHFQPGYGRVIFCLACFPQRWGEWMRARRAISDLHDAELLERMKQNTTTDGLVAGEEHARRVAAEVERARRAHPDKENAQ